MAFVIADGVAVIVIVTLIFLTVLLYVPVALMVLVVWLGLITTKLQFA